MNQDNINKKVFMGLNGFVWWFGIVENRADPDFLGRCQVRIFGFHDKNISKMPTKNLPWAHPITPLGQNTPSSPSEGSMVFGFFADGKVGNFPIMLGTVPNIPGAIPEEGEGFRDPFTEEQKATRPFPAKINSSEISVNASGPTVNTANAITNPGKILNEPTTSRLARPNRIESPETAESLGVRSESIEGTAIDFQRKNRLKYIKTAKEDASTEGTSSRRKQVVWNEPCPSYNAKFPFNHVQETESGHSFEMDDTKDYERVQLSHRTGSTIEFLPSGSIKEKSFNNKYDIVMGDHKEYVAGDKIDTIQGGMFLRINGKLVIQADGIDIESAGDLRIKGKKVAISADETMDLFSVAGTKIYGAAGAEIRTEGVMATYGGKGAMHASGGLTTISGVPNVISEAVRAILATVLPEKTLNEILDKRNPLECGVKVQGPNFYLNTIQGYYNSAITQFAPVSMPDVEADDGATVAGRYKAPTPRVVPTQSRNKKEKTDGLCAFERQFLGTLDLPNALKVTELNEEILNAAANANNTSILTANNTIPQFNFG